jgi:hypothetical protein
MPVSCDNESELHEDIIAVYDKSNMSRGWDKIQTRPQHPDSVDPFTGGLSGLRIHVSKVYILITPFSSSSSWKWSNCLWLRLISTTSTTTT